VLFWAAEIENSVSVEEVKAETTVAKSKIERIVEAYNACFFILSIEVLGL
jgi:hypothetical protein